MYPAFATASFRTAHDRMRKRQTSGSKFLPEMVEAKFISYPDYTLYIEARSAFWCSAKL